MSSLWEGIPHSQAAYMLSPVTGAVEMWARMLDAAWRWFRNRFIRRFDRVYIKTLSPDYHDKDDIYLHACFQILVDWVEREKGLDWWNPDGKGAVHEAHLEFKALYDWWTIERPKRYIEPPGTVLLTGDGKIEESNNTVYVENVWDNEDQEKLERLTKLRNSLWT